MLILDWSVVTLGRFSPNSLNSSFTGLILGLHPANERCRYKVTLSLVGLAQTYKQPWIIFMLLLRTFAYKWLFSQLVLLVNMIAYYELHFLQIYFTKFLSESFFRFISYDNECKYVVAWQWSGQSHCLNLKTVSKMCYYLVWLWTTS